MKILFLTTYDVSLAREHFFTRNVWKALVKHDAELGQGHSLALATINEDATGAAYADVTEQDGHEYHRLHLPKGLDRDVKVARISNFFSSIAPDVIHSNMMEGYDVEAARRVNIPICLTIHIGGFVCPRGGGSGFLRYDDSICHEPVSEKCARCVTKNLPLPGFAYALYKLCPARLMDYLSKNVRRNIFYLTPFLMARQSVRERLACIDLFKYATIIAANKRLVDLLAINGLNENVRLIPHGVGPRQRLTFPPLDNGPVKFYFLARVQYSKGLHVLLKALKGIDPAQYELHIIGDAEPSRKCQRYYNTVQRIGKEVNAIFHGRLPNDKIETLIKDYHVSVLPTFCHEIYGISIAESLSMGRPVLSTYCGGAEMQVNDGINGWLVPPNDTKKLHDKIQHLIDNRQEINRAALNANLPHPIENYIRELYKLYSELIG